MSIQAVLEIEKVELLQAVDDSRAATDCFEVLPADRAELNNRLAALKSSNAATLSTGSGRVTAQFQMRAAFDTLTARLHDGFNLIKAIPGYEITDAERQRLFMIYGWESVEIGELTDARLELLGIKQSRSRRRSPSRLPACEHLLIDQSIHRLLQRTRTLVLP